MPAGGYIKTNLQMWRESEGGDRYRRGLYVWFQRTSPYPQLMNFDGPDAQQTCIRRDRSTTPLQALNLLNDPVFVEAAQAMALRILREGSADFKDRLDYAFWLCFARGAVDGERNRLMKYYLQEKDRLTHDRASAEKLFPAGNVDGFDPIELATWVGVSSVLLNLDEFITRN